MNLYIINSIVDGIGLSQGDEIGVFDGDLCVGVGTVDNPGQEYIAIIASMDDPTTMVIDGFIEDHPFVLKAWKKQTGLEMSTQIINIQEGYTRYFTKNGTSVLTVNFEKIPETYLGDAFPNPSDNKTTFTFNLTFKCRVRLEIINPLGDLVQILVDDVLTEGLHKLEWDNRNANGHKTEAGVYFYRLRSEGLSITKPLVIY